MTILERLASRLYDNPRVVLALFLAALLAAIGPASRIQADFNLEGFYQEDDPVVVKYRVMEEEFGRDDNLIAVGVAFPDLLSKEGVERLMRLQERLEGLPFVEEVRSLAQAERMVNRADRLEFETWLEPGRAVGADGERNLLEDPFVEGFLLAERADAAGFYLDIEEENNTYANRNVLIDSLQVATAEFERRVRGAETHVSGIPYFRNLYVNMLNTEIVMYIAISSALIIALLWYLYRSVWGVVLPMVIVWATLLLSLAFIQLTGGYLEIMSTTIAPILLCVGVADSIHMISKYDDVRDAGLPKRAAVVEMMRTLGATTLLTSVTTAIGFATLASSSVMPMKRFGLYAAAGVLIAYLVTILVLPALLALTGERRIFNESKSRFYEASANALGRVSAFNLRAWKPVLWGALGVSLAAVWLAGGLQVNGRVFDDVSEDTVVMADQRWFAERLSPVLPIEVIVQTGREEGALDPQLMRELAELETFMLGYPEVRKVSGLHTLLDQVHRTLESPGGFLETATPSRLAQYVLLLEIGEAEGLEQMLDFTYGTTRLTALVEDAGSQRINEIRAELAAYLEGRFEGSDVLVTGSTVLSADLVGKLVRSLVGSVLLAFILISLIMAALFKDLKMVLISLVPNILPLMVTAAAMAVAGVDIKPSTAVIFTIAFGIAVDDSIHYLARLRIERPRLDSLEQAVEFTTRRTGRAIVITSMILLAGFGSLVTSDFVSTTMMGLLVSATVVTAVVADLMVLPALLYWLRPSRGPMAEGGAAVNQTSEAGSHGKGFPRGSVPPVPARRAG